jgi:hypothetical protein
MSQIDAPPPDRISHYVDALAAFAGALEGVLAGAVASNAVELSTGEITNAVRIEGLRITGSFAIADGRLNPDELAAVGIAAGFAGHDPAGYIDALRPHGLEADWKTETSLLLELLTRIDSGSEQHRVCANVYSLAAFRLAFEVAAIDGSISDAELTGLRSFLGVLDRAAQGD